MDSKYLHSLQKIARNLIITNSNPEEMPAFDYSNFPLTPSQALYIMSIKDERLVYQRNILNLLGYHEREFRFDTIFNLMHRDDKPIVETIVKNTLAFSEANGMSESAVLYLTYRLRRKDGNYIKVQRISGISSVTDSKALESNYSIIQDISYMGLSTAVRWDWNSPILNKEAYHKYIKVMPEDLFSKRELQIYKLMKNGVKGAEIAEKLHISPNTVKSHKHKMVQKTGLFSTTDLVDYFENKAFQPRH